MVYSIIQKSQLEGALRLDAEYYQPDYLKMAQKLRGLESKILKNYTQKIERGTQPIYTKNGSVLAIKSVYVRNDFLDDSGDEFVDEEYYIKNKKSQVKKYDVLLNSTGVGTLGRSNYYYLDKKAIVDGHVTIIRTGEKLNSIYLDTFLKTNYGQFQINRQFSGSSGQIEIYPDNIGSIEIFLPNKIIQDQIASICNEAHNKETQSKELLENAENLLLEELEINNFKEKICFMANFLEVEEAERMDAEYFQPKYLELINHINKNCNGVRLGDLVTIKKGFEPGAEEYKEEGKLFIRVSSLSKTGIENNDQKYLSDKLYDELKNDFEPKRGEILLTKDATPGIAYVVKDDIEGIISGGILRLQLKNKDIEDEYLTLCLNSIVGQMQAERDAGGSVIAHWKPEQIKNVVIPILPKEKQEKITSLIRESFAARVKAKELLDEAKKKVEEMIEKGEK